MMHVFKKSPFMVGAVCLCAAIEATATPVVTEYEVVKPYNITEPPTLVQLSRFGDTYQGTREIFANELVDAASANDIDKVQTILQKSKQSGKNTKDIVNAAGNSKTTALMRAAYNGNVDMARLLIENGANVNVVNSYGQSALYIAAVNGHMDMAEFLVQNDAKKLVLSEEEKQRFEEAALPIVAAPAVPLWGTTAATAAAVGGGIAVAATIGNDDGEAGAASSSVNAAAASSGAGVTIAIIDAGVDKDALALGDKYSTNSINFIGTSDNDGDGLPDGDGDGTPAGAVDPTTKRDHGTRIAQIIHNEVPDSQIMSIIAIDHAKLSGFDDKDAAASIRHANNNNADIINIGFGVQGTNAQDDMVAYKILMPKTLVEINNAVPGPQGSLAGQDELTETQLADVAGPLFVWAAGNSNESHVYPGAGLWTDPTFEHVKFNWLAVVSLKENGLELNDNSNHCGIAQERCLGAIAGSTSEASALVSAAASKLVSVGLTPTQAGKRILDTAIYLGSDGNDTNADTGHGRLNEVLATQPIGIQLVAVGGGANASLFFAENSQIITSSAFGDAFINSGLSFNVVDNGGDKDGQLGSIKFSHALANYVVPEINNFNFDEEFINFSRDSNYNKIKITDNATLAFNNVDLSTKQDEAMKFDDVNDLQNKKQAQFSLNVDNKNSKLNLGINADFARDFGFGALDQKTTSVYSSAFTNPYLGFIGEGVSTSLAFAYDNAGKTINKSGVFYGELKDNNLYITNADLSNEARVSGFVNETSKIFGADDRYKFSIQFGMLKEDESFLGSRSKGVFAIGDEGGNTMFYAASASIDLVFDTSLFATYSAGTSQISSSVYSLFSDFSTIKSESFAFGLTTEGIFAKEDRLTFSVASPLRVTAGQASLWDYGAIDLSPSGQEMDFAIAYEAIISDKSSVKLGLMHREEPGHIKQASADDVVMTGYKFRF